ncbi:MAG: hypothetical protein E7161_04445 [Firmicutes bacterium]|nr:hypothetical protein [Bacillota bacterium]
MIEIYFDGVLIDSDYYAGITNDFRLFDEEFYLGSTASNTFKIEVPMSAVQTIPHEVVIRLDNKDYANLIVDSYEILDNNILSLSLTDKMTLFNFSYDASPIVPCSVKDILQNICLIQGVELGTTEFINSDVQVDFYNNTITAREYIGYIAELNGGYAVIGQDGKLYLRQFDSVPVEINVDDCEDFKIGEKHIIERVVFDNGLLKYETSADENLETLYLNTENVYITSEDIFNNIVNQIIGFEFYSFETGNCIINSNILAGDLISFVNGEENYISIAQYNLDFNGAWIGGYSLNVNSKHQQETKQKGNNDKIKHINVELNRIDNEVKIAVETQNAQKETLSEITIETDTISQRVSDTETTINDLNQTITTIESTFLEQTSENFTMWFEQTGVQGTIDDLKDLVNNQNTTLDQLRAYIRYGVITDVEDEFYGSPYAEFGKEDAQTKLRILDNRIQFLTGETETAYISNNALYINESTILTKQVIGKSGIGKWITEIDEQGNLNTYWGGVE